MGTRSTCMITFTVFFWICVIVGVALFGSSFGTVDINRAALYQNKYTVQIETDKVYLSGRYFTGLGGQFLDYPTTWQYINFSSDYGSDAPIINAKSSAGTSISLEVTLVFRIQYEFLAKLYSNYKKNYLKSMLSTAKDSISKVVTEYTAVDFFQKRKTIENEMSQRLSSRFKDNFQCELIMLLLREIVLDQRFENTIIQSQVKGQEVKTADQQNKIQTINAQISVISSDADLKINKNLAEANAQASEIIAKKTAEGDTLIRQAEGLALKNFMLPTTEKDPSGEEGLGFTDAQVLRFLYLEKLISMKNIQMMLDLPDTTLYQV